MKCKELLGVHHGHPDVHDVYFAVNNHSARPNLRIQAQALEQ